MAKKHF
ncbi:hypothetical protein CGLO_13572 [Colletotrichum gloeosporioides Cg-14]|nr:hypothetical protein CGLO_13572 [Colletotrichum gloeosporioides Cg-14]